jgi:SPP1 family predicted phage head-tail adaptor
MSVIGAGQLNQRVRIQQPTTVKDTLGSPTQVWADVAVVWADIAPLSGREARIADRIASEVSHQITVRYQPLFADPRSVAQMRVLFKGRVFALHGALNEDEANVVVILLASEGVRDG